MATSMYLRRMRRFEAGNPEKKAKTSMDKSTYSQMSFAEKTKAAAKLIREGKASTKKEAWAIIKTW